MEVAPPRSLRLWGIFDPMQNIAAACLTSANLRERALEAFLASEAFPRRLRSKSFLPRYFFMLFAEDGPRTRCSVLAMGLFLVHPRDEDAQSGQGNSAAFRDLGVASGNQHGDGAGFDGKVKSRRVG